MDGEELKAGLFWERRTDGRLQCQVCPHECLLAEGQRGLCFVRARVGERIVLTTYGRSSGFCVDPIEKKPLNHFLPGTAVLSFGTAGCNLNCRFCQNWSISRSRETEQLSAKAAPDAIASAARAHKCRSVAFTYNDPVIFLEYAVDTAQACHEQGIRTVAVTAGYMREAAREYFYSHMDAANVDLKGFTERFYKDLCGGHLQPVLDTLLYIRQKTHVWLEITTLLIPGENDSESELEEMTQWVAGNLGSDVPLHFTAFHPAWKMDRSPPTPASSLFMARRIAIKNGLRYVYTGNIRSVEGSQTVCHACGALLIEREGYTISAWHLNEHGACSACGTTCSGVFDAEPGTWGARALPIEV